MSTTNNRALAAFLKAEGKQNTQFFKNLKVNVTDVKANVDAKFDLKKLTSVQLKTLKRMKFKNRDLSKEISTAITAVENKAKSDAAAPKSTRVKKPAEPR